MQKGEINSVEDLNAGFLQTRSGSRRLLFFNRKWRPLLDDRNTAVKNIQEGIQKNVENTAFSVKIKDTYNDEPERQQMHALLSLNIGNVVAGIENAKNKNFLPILNILKI